MKSLVKACLRRVGWQLQRIPVVQKESEEQVLTFGEFRIATDNKALVHSYKTYQETNQAIGRLAALVGSAFPSGLLIDIGANCGDTAAILRCNSSLPILCVEGDPTLVKWLQRNVRQLDNVEILEIYLGENSSEIPVEIRNEGWNNTIIPAKTGSRILPVFRLDDLQHPRLSKEKIVLLKCDTEGFDVAILHGARQLLARDRPILTFEYNRQNMSAIQENGIRVFELLRTLNYSTLLFYDAYGRMVLTSEAAREDLIRDLHDYVDAARGAVYYYDVIAFPQEFRQMASEFVASERRYRLNR